MGGLFSAPVAPIQSNEAQLMMVREQSRQNDLLQAQHQETLKEMQEANDAQNDQQRALELREADAAAAKQEREDRIAQGKKDLLYYNALGVEDEEEDSMLKLGGA